MPGETNHWLPPCIILIKPPPWTADNLKKSCLNEVKEVERQTKKCPELFQQLWSILKMVWRIGKIGVEVHCNRRDIYCSGVPGCLEHTSVAIQFIIEAIESKEHIALLWLDLTTPHGGMDKYPIRQRVKFLVLDYYNKYSLMASADQLTPDSHKLELRIFTKWPSLAI